MINQPASQPSIFTTVSSITLVSQLVRSTTNSSNKCGCQLTMKMCPKAVINSFSFFFFFFFFQTACADCCCCLLACTLQIDLQATTLFTTYLSLSSLSSIHTDNVSNRWWWPSSPHNNKPITQMM